MQDWRKNKLAFAILMAPASFWLILFFTVPLAIVWVYSFGGRGPEGQTLIQFSFDNYRRSLEWIHLGIIWKSIVIGTIIFRRDMARCMFSKDPPQIRW